MVKEGKRKHRHWSNFDVVAAARDRGYREVSPSEGTPSEEQLGRVIKAHVWAGVPLDAVLEADGLPQDPYTQNMLRRAATTFLNVMEADEVTAVHGRRRSV